MGEGTRARSSRVPCVAELIFEMGRCLSLTQSQYDLSNMWRNGSAGQTDYIAIFPDDGSTFYVYV